MLRVYAVCRCVCICTRHGMCAGLTASGPEVALLGSTLGVPCFLCDGWDDCCECLCNEVVLFPIVLLILKLVSRPTSAAGAPADRWAAVGSSTSPPPTPFLTHSSDRYVFSLRSLLHPELGVLCVSQNGSYTADVDEPSS